MAVSVQDDFWEAAQYMPEDQARDFIYALVRFGATGEEPEPGAPWYPTFVACKGRVELSIARKRKAQRMADARWSGDGDGARGQGERADAPEHGEGAMHKDAQASPARDARERSSIAGSRCTDAPEHDARERASIMHGDAQASTSGDAEYESESEKEIEKEKVKKRKRAAPPRFSPPSPDEVAAYAEGLGLGIDPAAFVDFYAAKGWRVGTSPMRDWRAAVRNWCRRDARGKPGAAPSAPPRGAVGDEYAAL